MQSAQLAELAFYWQENHGSVPRALVVMLSGKQPVASTASGVGYVNGLCSGDYGYSFNQVYNSPASPAAADAFLVAHELGHNFGSVHTHCYDPPIDTCSSLEGLWGCFGGIPSCPPPATMNGLPNVRGTLMSYCNGLAGCSATATFHPRTLEVLNPLLAARVGVCLFPRLDEGAGRFYPLPPCRLVDTRGPLGARGGPGLASGEARAIPITGACGLPAGAKAVSGNLTVAAPAVSGFLNVFPTGTPTSIALVHYRAGQVRANNVVLKLPASGSLTFDNGSPGLTHFLLDVNGYFK